MKYFYSNETTINQKKTNSIKNILVPVKQPLIIQTNRVKNILGPLYRSNCFIQISK